MNLSSGKSCLPMTTIFHFDNRSPDPHLTPKNSKKMKNMENP